MRAVRRSRVRRVVAAGALTAALGCTVGCAAEDPSMAPPSASPPAPSPSAGTAAQVPVEPVPELPAGALRELVPAPAEAPAGLVPLLQASGPRDAAAVAAFSADPASAAADLAARGFLDAYAAQYAAPGDPRSLTAVVVRFSSPDGARTDLEADLADSAGEVVSAEQVGDSSQVRRLPLPGDDALDLVTVRFRVGATTWLLAWRAPVPADPAVPLALAATLAARG